MDLFEAIMSALKAVWDYLKRLVLKVINFVKNIVSWFLEPARAEQVRKNKDLLAVAIKERLASGKYNVVNCLFNKETESLVDHEEHALVIEADKLDKETKANFGKQDMIVIQ